MTNEPRTTKRSPWRWLIPAIGLGAMTLPAWVFFSARGGTTFLQGQDARTFAVSIFPLIGLYAFTLVWMQIMLGSLMPLWHRWWPRIFYYHRAQGVFALLFALTHPTLLWFDVGTPKYLARDFVAPEHIPFVFFGYVALLCILLTVTTALLMRTTVAKQYWRKLHYLNYIVFFSAGIHSYVLGSDIQSTGLRFVWIGYAAAVCTAIMFRVTRYKRTSQHEQSPVTPPSETQTI